MAVVQVRPALSDSRVRRLAAPLTTIGTLTAATVALHFRDPHQSGSWGYCPMYAATGLYCPGCGGLRAVNDLTDGHVGAALSSNILVTLGIPLAIFGLLLWTSHRWTGRTGSLDPTRFKPVGYASIVLVVAFTVLRNLPVGSWLAP